MSILAIRSVTRGLQSTEKQGFRNGTHTQTYTQLMDIATYTLYLAQRADAVKIKSITVFHLEISWVCNNRK